GVVVETLRRGEGGPERLARSLTSAFVQGVAVDWAGFFPRAQLVDLPTYAFQHKRYWLESGAADGGGYGWGAAPGGHPFLGGVVELAGGLGWVFTGRVSLAAQGWLADHAVLGSVIVPGTVWVDIALRAGAVAGCPVVEELTLHSPLVVPEQAAVQLQVTVGAADAAGARPFALHARPEGPAEDEPEWTQHATGTLTTVTARATDGPDLTEWPPRGAVPVDVHDFYPRLATAGVAYGPAFRGVRAAWRRGDELFAEVALAEELADGASQFEVHPALLDAAVQTLQVRSPATRAEDDPGAVPEPARSGDARVAYSWRGVRMLTPGATHLRTRLLPTGDESMSLTVADADGQLVADIDELAVRRITAGQIQAAGGVRRRSLYHAVWRPVPVPDASEVRLARVGPDVGGESTEQYPTLAALGEAVAAGAALPDAVVVRAEQLGTEALPNLGDWPSDDRFADVPLLVLTTRTLTIDGDPAAPTHTDPTDTDSTSTEPPSTAPTHLPAQPPTHPAAPHGASGAQAAVRRTPRTVLVDTDAADAPPASTLRAALTCGAQQLAVRGGQLLAPRLARYDAHGAPVPAARRAAGDDREQQGVSTAADRPAAGTVLVTGAAGGFLGALVRHLVSVHDLRHLLLVPRAGAESAVRELVAEFVRDGSGVSATVLPCTTADHPAALAAALADIDPGEPLTGVIHATDLPADQPPATADEPPTDTTGHTPNTPDMPGTHDTEPATHSVATGLATAWHLHELTAERPLAFFVTLSPATDLLALPQQTHPAASSPGYHTLAAHRRAHGLPAVSLAWGPLTGQPQPAPPGAVALGHDHAIALFDAALASGARALIPAQLDLAALRASSHPVPDALRDLLPPAGGGAGEQAGDAAVDADALRQRLAGLAEVERERVLLGLVRGHAAAVLGHIDVAEVGPDRAFKEAGFDSLTAVELRNRLTRSTGVKLRSTVVFDFPTAAALTRHLTQQLGAELSPAAPVLAELDRLEDALPSALAENGTRDRVIARLRDLLARCDTADGSPPGSAPDADDLGAASDDELFSMVDQGFE
ncbi:polyketide synthase dehydratase domain-containing protein, partial [Streptomyces sp. 796.1]|uniref:polyketide synthase dehydratase domain-containing protein n=1 Tax=Streptomyces sp. 796.1 TaxID=3163029 RepID=UPI0039C98A7F